MQRIPANRQLTPPTYRRNAAQTIQRRGLSVVLRLITAGLQDRLRQFMGLPPLYVKLIGTKGELAFMQARCLTYDAAVCTAKHAPQLAPQARCTTSCGMTTASYCIVHMLSRRSSVLFELVRDGYR